MKKTISNDHLSLFTTSTVSWLVPSKKDDNQRKSKHKNEISNHVRYSLLLSTKLPWNQTKDIAFVFEQQTTGIAFLFCEVKKLLEFLQYWWKFNKFGHQRSSQRQVSFGSSLHTVTECPRPYYHSYHPTKS